MDKIWKPTKRQEDFIAIPDTVFEGLYGGAAGGGKTDCLLMLPIVRKFYESPRFKLLFLRRTFPELDNEVVPRSKSWYPLAGFYPYQEQKKRWTHPSGAIIQLGHCENVKDVTRYDTSEYNIIVFDELTSFVEYQYLYLTMSRCRSADSNLPAFVRSGTNPGNIGHGFVRRRFVEPARQGNVILKERREFHGQTTELLRIFIPSKATDNTYLMKSDPGYISRLNALPVAERAAKLEGDWWTFAGQVFEDWRDEPFPGEPENARHVIPSFTIPAYWPRVLSIDWGYAALTVAGWYAINPCPSSKYPAKIYKYREYSARKAKISSWGADIARLSQGEEFVDVVLDPSAWGHRGDDFTICEQFAQVSGLKPRKADKDRIGGKMLLQDLLRWQPRAPRYIPQEDFSQELLDKISRMQGPKAAEEYIRLFLPEEPERFLPKFQVFDECTGTKENIPLCVYAGPEEEHPEDVADTRNDTADFYDETRYGIKACQHYLEVGIAEHNKVEQVAKLCSEAEQSGNMTDFYRKMDNLEAHEAKAPRGIRRFHNNPRLRCNW